VCGSASKSIDTSGLEEVEYTEDEPLPPPEVMYNSYIYIYIYIS
jgi:hypothetical protein